jgi:Resolvase, N terminal domain.
MARLGYIRCRRKQDIEEFKVVSHAEKLFIDLVNEIGETGGKEFEEVMNTLSPSDTLVLRSLSEVADDVSDLRLFLSIIRNLNVELVLLDSRNKRFLTDDSFETLSFINDFVEEKQRVEEIRLRKIGRKLLPYPDDFLKIYGEYKAGVYNSNDAAKLLGINAHRFRELVRTFEV